MELIDNINNTLKGDFVTELRSGSKVAIANSCFSIYIFPNSINPYTIYCPRGAPMLNTLY